MAVALVEYQAGGLSFELGRKGTTLLGHQTPLYGEHSRPKWVSGISRPLEEIGAPEPCAGALTDFGRVERILAHGLIFSRVEAITKSGAIE